ncbi:MAG: type II toxin-antitoxin system VapC family toxin [Candidatus Aminicenantes bacterium]|jgi:predicted nucleic acid-binding protein
MVLVDTSVWVSHFRYGNCHLEKLLNNEDVMCHPFVIGELACGNMENRDEILLLLHSLPTAGLAEQSEVLRFINAHRLMGRGLGLIDIHLLISALLSDVLFWTLDKKLRLVSFESNVCYCPALWAINYQ